MRFESKILKEFEVDSLITLEMKKDSKIVKEFELYSKIDFKDGNHE